jgi:hypothetical protein
MPPLFILFLILSSPYYHSESKFYFFGVNYLKTSFTFEELKKVLYVIYVPESIKNILLRFL